MRQCLNSSLSSAIVLWFLTAQSAKYLVLSNSSKVTQKHWMPVRQRIDYKLAVLTHKIRATSTPSYLSDHIRPRETTRQLRSSTMPLLHRPTTRTHFTDRAFRCCAPSVWNSLDSETLHCSSISGFKRRLKTLLFHQAFSSTT